MLYKKIKKDYEEISDINQVNQGDIVKYSNKNPKTSGTLYFVKNKDGEYLVLENSISRVSANYSISQGKFIF